MGSERKSRDRRKRSSHSSASDSEDEGRRSRRHRTSHDDAERSSSKRRKEEKSHKHSKRHSKNKLEREHKSRHSKHGHHSDVEFCKLSKDDYYSKNNEFATWLKEERDQFFSDLSSQSARELFSEFVADWNDHKLETKYYEGIIAGPRTAHKWKIRK
ncbi:hypothetical protein Ancab_001561 [Ancistrocladus abbreviatus]